MNLWGRLAGLIFLVFIIFSSCQEDETSLLGFRKSADKFRVALKEIDLTSSVMSIDSVRTFNDQSLNSKRRLLVGKYVDNKFGEITSEAYTQFGPVDPTVIIPKGATFAFGYLLLSFDFSYYGDDQVSTANFSVHELLDSLPPIFDPLGELPKNIQSITNYQPYFFNTSIPYDPNPIGSTSFLVEPLTFDKIANDLIKNPANLDHKTIDSLSIPLSDNYTQKLFDLAQGRSKDYTVLTRFRRIFKGLVIRPEMTDTKILGINPVIDSSKFAKSKIVLLYDQLDTATGAPVRKKLEYSLFNEAPDQQIFGFSRIMADRGSSPLALLSTPGIESELDGNRYYQSGNPITTKIKFDKFLEFADTIPNMLFNSVELSIDLEDSETFKPPSTMYLRYLNSSNEFVHGQTNVSSERFLRTDASMNFDEEGWFIIDQKLNYNSDSKQYLADLTDYFQYLYDTKEAELRFTNFTLAADSPPIGLSVNRAFFNKDKIKLKVIYTIPALDK